MAYKTYDIGDGITLYIEAYHNGVLVANTRYTLSVTEPATATLEERTSVITQTTTTVTVDGVPVVTTGQTNFVVNPLKGRYEYVFAAKRSGKHKYHWLVDGSMAAEELGFAVRKTTFITET